MRTKLAVLVALFAMLFAAPAFAQYNKGAGVNKPKLEKSRSVRLSDGTLKDEIYYEEAPVDRWGNTQGNQGDLAVDGAFDGQTVAVIQLYDFPFDLVKAALKEKGFSVYRWVRRAPSPEDLEAALQKSSQLWIIATDSRQLTPDHLRVIKKFYDEGHGLYIWGDNLPFYADANYLSEALFGTTMQGDLRGDQTVGLLELSDDGGIKPNHLLTTGLEHLYEGITIATIQPNDTLEPLLYGSAGNLVAAYYDKNGRRAILDGGFTRLYNKWDTAGTARYVKNAASWLVNAEKFGDAVINPAIKAKSVSKPVTEKPVVTMTTAPAATQRPWIASGLVGLILAGCVLLLLVTSIAPIGRKD
jgi:hypothetical protein